MCDTLSSTQWCCTRLKFRYRKVFFKARHSWYFHLRVGLQYPVTLGLFSEKQSRLLVLAYSFQVMYLVFLTRFQNFYGVFYFKSVSWVIFRLVIHYCDFEQRLSDPDSIVGRNLNPRRSNRADNGKRGRQVKAGLISLPRGFRWLSQHWALPANDGKFSRGLDIWLHIDYQLDTPIIIYS